MAYIHQKVALPAQTAGGAASTTILGIVPSTFGQTNYLLGRLSLTSPSLVTGQATNYVTIAFRHMRAGVAVATLGTYTMSTAPVTLPAETEQVVAITGTPDIRAGDVLEVICTQVGTGLALPASVIAQVELE
jgi:hypothetical protein